MKLTSPTLIFFFFFSITVSISAQSSTSRLENYLSWGAAQAESIGKQTRESGKAGGVFDVRGIGTDRAINYKVRATLMTPEVIRASARFAQLRDRLTDEQTRTLVDEAEEAGDLIVMVEIDPNEGSGVIPLDWRVFLQPKGLQPGVEGAVIGIKSPQLRSVKALSGVTRRDYNYDVFWVVFPLSDGKRVAVIPAGTAEIQLIVGIYSKEARISWKMPASIREKIASIK